ncbi:hypothetical protein IWW48_001051 [Coemansia sp. RSA 1200]|nr:hypothetical protein IWW48_001051 [Coemansia sp. RSA 1200]
MNSLFDKLSLRLENKGSVARDHLANERTYLAWIRTSLSMVTVGVAIRQLYRVSIDLGRNSADASGSDTGSGPSPDDPLAGIVLGVCFVFLGMLFVFIGLYRYFRSQLLMTKGKFPVSRTMVGACAAATLALLIRSNAVTPMRPDSYKQKASRRYQVKHGDHNRNATSQRKTTAVPEQPHIAEYTDIQHQQQHTEDGSSADVAANTSKQEADDFLNYLKEGSQSITGSIPQQSSNTGVFFKLREEIESEGLGRYADAIWDRLLDVDVDRLAASLAHSVKETPLNAVLGFKDDLAAEFPVPAPSISVSTKSSSKQDSKASPLSPIHKQTTALAPMALTAVSSACLAPGLKQQAKPTPTSGAPKNQANPQQQPKKPNAPPADDLEAFLDDIL